MTNKIDDGGPAYPQHDLSAYGLGPSERGEHGDEPDDFGTRRYTCEGMSLRDAYAIAALQGAVSGHFAHYGHENHWDFDALAAYAHNVADAMLAARKAGA